MAEEKKTKTTKKKEEEKVITNKEPEIASETNNEPIKEKESEILDNEASKKSPEESNESVEEFKVEKRFCTKCGKELSAGETCDCETNTTTPGVSVNINTEVLTKYCKNFWHTIVNMYKKPATTIDEAVAKKDTKGSLIMLIIIALTYGLCIISNFNSLIGVIEGELSMSALSELPYFKIFVYTAVINFILSFVPITVAFITNKISGTGNLDYQKSLSLYATSYAPTVITNLIMAFMSYFNILSWLGLIIGAIVEIICFFNYCLGYLRITKPKDDKKSYIISGLISIWFVLSLLIASLFLSSLFNDILRDINIKSSNNYYDFFN